ncbi:hypothetical protein [Glycomyces salinus]|uniref:hypothetical protein n=1 Tax=Glycomyces salinus TaxID=980294 RepID=UPI0018EB10A1|nr:hypothetical protein [Glycomyces salinus]
MNSRNAHDLPWTPPPGKPTTSRYRDPGVANLIAVNIAWQLGDDWSHGFDHRNRKLITGPDSTQIEVAAYAESGTWRLLLTGRFPTGYEPDRHHAIWVEATLPPSAIAAQIRSRLLPAYEPALGRAVAAEQADLARHQLRFDRAHALALTLGPGWRVRTCAGTGPVQVVPDRAAGADLPFPAPEGFTVTDTGCQIALTVDQHLAAYLAASIAAYPAIREEIEKL